MGNSAFLRLLAIFSFCVLRVESHQADRAHTRQVEPARFLTLAGWEHALLEPNRDIIQFRRYMITLNRETHSRRAGT